MNPTSPPLGRWTVRPVRHHQSSASLRRWAKRTRSSTNPQPFSDPVALTPKFDEHALADRASPGHGGEADPDLGRPERWFYYSLLGRTTLTPDLVSFTDVLPSMPYVNLHGTLRQIPGVSVQGQPLEKCCSEVDFLDGLKTSYRESIRQGLARLPLIPLGQIPLGFAEPRIPSDSSFRYYRPIFAAEKHCTTLACCGVGQRTARLYQFTGPPYPQVLRSRHVREVVQVLGLQDEFPTPSPYQARKTTEDSRAIQVSPLEMSEISLRKSLLSFSPISINKIGRPFRKILRLRIQETPCRCTTLASIPTQIRDLETRSAHEDRCVIHAVTLA